MDDYTADDVQEALRPIVSLISKSEKALQKLAPGTWQHTMLGDNLRALRIASALMEKETGDADTFTRDDVRAALPALASMLRKTEEAQAKFSTGTSQYTLLRNRLKALRVALSLLERKGTEISYNTGMKESAHSTTRAFEVEVRAHIPDEDFAGMLAKLAASFGEPEVTEMKTFLFRGASGHGRIRIFKGATRGVLTEKIGGYADKAREEIEKEFDLADVDSALAELRDRGLIECSYLRSARYTFSGPGDQKLFLSKHEHLGNFLEVELLVNGEASVKEAHAAVSKTLTELGLEELPAATYQRMMDELYAETLRPVSEHKSEIASF